MPSQSPFAGSKVLASYAWLLKANEHVIRCPKMRLEGWHDNEPPIFEGSGRLRLNRHSDISFEFDARPLDLKVAMRALRRCAEEPHDHTSAMRLLATDYDGQEWNAGWVLPRLGEVYEDRHSLFGESRSIVTHGKQETPASGVELVYSPAPDVPFTEVMHTTARLGETELGTRFDGGRHCMQILGSDVSVTTEPWSTDLWICAKASDSLNHPYLENWLSEPLRALRGQLIYPRLVARNFADGRSAIWVRSAPELRNSMGGCALDLRDRSAGEFWRFYAAYLEYVGLHRDENGQPEFEANELTRLHDEVIQARVAGSHWVIALCVASAIEGLVKLDPSFGATPADFTAQELEPAKRAISRLTPETLRNRLSNSLAHSTQPSPGKYLTELQRDGKISAAQVTAWKKIRNQVTHGNLFEPWGSREEHDHLVELLRLFYRLTALRIGYR